MSTIQAPKKVGEKTTTKTSVAWFLTTDTQLAAFLFTCGCEFETPRLVKFEKASDPSYQKCRWRFKCNSEKNTYGYTLDETIAIWKDAYEFIAENQENPVSLILAGFKNFQKFKELLSDENLQNTLVEYKTNGQTLQLIKGSQKEQKIRKKLGYE